MQEHWIWLATRQGLSDQAKYKLLRHFTDPERVYTAPREALAEIPRLTPKVLESLEDKDLTQARQILAKCRRKDIRLLTLNDSDYPRKLLEIPDPPILLYCLGTLPQWQERPVIGAVGTRSCSDYGIRSGQKLGYELSRAGAVVVSGLAEGVDTAVLTGALSAGGTPVVFLAGGVDIVYPVQNSGLYRKVLSQGCVMSEYPPGTRHLKWNFPARNRLISGISQAVLVVEAPEKSGALITARYAMKQGRQVYVVPSPIDVTSGQGSNALLAEGARMARCAGDILQCPQATREEASDPWRSAEKHQKAYQNPPKAKKVIDNSPKPLYIDVEKKLAVRSPQEQAIIDQLRSGPRLTDAVLNDCGLPRGEALAVMTMLEVSGILRRLPGNLMKIEME